VLWAIARACERTGKKDAARAYVKDAAKVFDEAVACAPEALRADFWTPLERAELRKTRLG